MKVGSAFAGIGGFDLAAERAGMEVAWTSEVEKTCATTLSEHGLAPNLGDIQQVNARSASEVELLVGGSPCQGFSVAGVGMGLEDERSGLFGELIRVRNELDPEWLLWENVPGVLTSSRGEDFANVLAAMVGSDHPVVLPARSGGRRSRHAGVIYGPRGSAAWRVLDAQYFGVPQRRARVIAVASRDEEAPARVLLPGVTLDGEEVLGEDTVTVLLDDERKGVGPDPVKVWSALAAILESEVDDDLFLSERACLGILERSGRRQRALPPAMEWALRVQAGEHPDAEAPEYESICFDPTFLGSPHGGGVGHDQLPSLRRSSYKDVHGLVVPLTYRKSRRAQSKTDHETWVEDHVANTLNTFENTEVRATNLVVERLQQSGAPYGIRRLTLTEGERAMGFPDGWTEPCGSKSARWKALGNAVAVPVAEWIMQRLAAEMGEVAQDAA